VSRLVERKGIDTIIAALPKLPDVELIVAGGPPRDQLRSHEEARRLRRDADALGVGDRTVFAGQVPQSSLPALYRSADVVVCTPWYEPFGIVPLEAMACGVPVVVSAVGGLVDTVLAGSTGEHVPARDPDALANVLSRLLAEAHLRAAMGRRGAQRARGRYGWDAIAVETLRAYRAVVPQEHEHGRSVG
jgi:glycosyltransferase involved in cell wall biosynthesis